MKSEGKQAGRPVLRGEHISAIVRKEDVVYIREVKGEMGTYTPEIWKLSCRSKEA